MADTNHPTTFKTPDHLQSNRLLRTYVQWRRLAGERFAPTRSEIAPAQFKSDLAHVFLMDVLDEGSDFRFRLGGERIVEFMGGRHAGRLLSDFVGLPAYEQMHRFFQAAVKRRTAVAAGPVSLNRDGREAVAMEVLAMPLSDDGTGVTDVFGAMDFLKLPD